MDVFIEWKDIRTAKSIYRVKNL